MVGNKCLCMGSMGGCGRVSPPRTRSSTGASLALVILRMGANPSSRPRARSPSSPSLADSNEGLRLDIRDLVRDLAEACERYSVSMSEVSQLRTFNADQETTLTTL